MTSSIGPRLYTPTSTGVEIAGLGTDLLPLDWPLHNQQTNGANISIA